MPANMDDGTLLELASSDEVVSTADLEPVQRSSIPQELQRYLVVGGIAFLVDAGVLLLLTEFGGVHYLISAAVGFLCGLCINYALCVAWVFKTRRLESRRAEFVVFALIGVAGLGLTELIMFTCTGLARIDYRWAKIVAVGVVFLWNFAIRKMMLFHQSASLERSK